MGSLSDCSQAMRRQGGAVEAPPSPSPQVWRCQRLRAPAAPGASQAAREHVHQALGLVYGASRPWLESWTRAAGWADSACPAPRRQAESPGKGARKPKGFYAHPRGCTAAYGTRRLRATDKLTVIYSELGSRAARGCLARVRELETRGSVP